MESDTRSDEEKAAASQSGLGEAGTSRFANGTGSSPSVRRVLFPPVEELAPLGEQCPQCARQTAYSRYPRDWCTLRSDYRFFKQD